MHIKKVMLTSFFKVKKSKSFEYKPRFYDADKEEFEQRVAQAANQGQSEDIATIKNRIRDGFEFQRPQKNKKGLLSSHKFLIYLLGLLLLLMLFWR